MGVEANVDGPSKYPGKLTFRVIITCIMAATGGLIFGYDHGVSGNSFLLFFLLKFIASMLINVFLN